jgi:ESS family glutamate:Na+ symporter
MTALLAWIVHGTRLSWGAFAGILLSMMGVAVILSGGDNARLLSMHFGTGDLLILIAVLLGHSINRWAKEAGLVLPGFLTAMLAGVVITNVADATGLRLEFAPIERNGEMALQVFLAISLMSLQLWTISHAIPPLLTNVVAQVVATTAVAVLVLFPLLGRDYDAAVACGGFLGFGLSSMPVAMATMDQVTSRFGPAPRAFLLITLAGSFFVDLANALIVKVFLTLPMFH